MFSALNIYASEYVSSEEEEQLIAEVQNWLESEHPEEGRLVEERLRSLRNLGDVVSQYPSLHDPQTLRGEYRNEEQLLEALCSFSASSRLLHIPTKVVIARAYLVTKYHALALLARLAHRNSSFYQPLRTIVFSVVCTLMAEEVYFSCLDDPSFPQNIRHKIARDLVFLWDSGKDPRAIRHLPALKALWTARDKAPPAFGTMNGSSELMRITMDLGPDWDHFIIQEANNDETRWALEEFLFGLSHEEIKQVRDRLIRYQIPAVNYKDIPSHLGTRPSLTAIDEGDLRTIYDFFTDRRAAALRRKQTGAPGPRQTLEEIYLRFRILQEEAPLT